MNTKKALGDDKYHLEAKNIITEFKKKKKTVTVFLKCQVEEISQTLEAKCKAIKTGTENTRGFIDGQMRSYVFIIINVG